jgi:phage terminase large subunit
MIPIVQIPEVKRVDYPGIKIGSSKESLVTLSLPELLPYAPDWGADFFEPATFKALYGGRAAAKSHFFAEMMLARMILDPDLQCVIIRKYRSDITYSAKLLLENKISARGWNDYFDILGNTIRRKNGNGFIAYTGMQDHNANSIKSYENFKIAWSEESNELDQFSIDLMVPTIRSEGSELWFSWNPDQPTDPVDNMFRGGPPPADSIVKKVSFKENPHLTDKSKQDEQDMLARDPEKHAWIWLGEYNVKSNAIIFAGRWRVGEVDTTGWDGPYYGADFGFVIDPTTAAKQWRLGNQIYIEKESYSYGLQIDHIKDRWIEDIPDIANKVIKADSSEQDTIAYLKRHGLPNIRPVEKGPGSVETGVKWLKSHEIIVHPDCVNFQDELKRYRLKTNKAGEVLDDIVDKDNHLIDQCRYAFQPLIKNQQIGPYTGNSFATIAPATTNRHKPKQRSGFR